jgi:predicted peptidase
MIKDAPNSSFLIVIPQWLGQQLTRCHLSFVKLPIVAIALAIIGCAMTIVSCSSIRPVSKDPAEPASMSDLNVTAHSVSWTSQAKYLVYLPPGYQSTGLQRWPLILFLHGIGECGTDVWRTATYGPLQYAEKHHDFAFIVVSPQCPIGNKWSNEAVLSVLDDVVSKYAVDTNRIYLTGLSQGGFGVWSLATTYPQRFTAVAPISGGGDVLGFIVAKWNRDRTAPLKNLPVWAFHGAKDPVVSVSEDIRMVDALKKFGDSDVKLTIYPEGQHNVWDETYANPELYQWFLGHDLSAKN